jgi:hypothetical protein
MPRESGRIPQQWKFQKSGMRSSVEREGAAFRRLGDIEILKVLNFLAHPALIDGLKESKDHV